MPRIVDLHLDVFRERRRPRATVVLGLERALTLLDAELALCGYGTVCVGARLEHEPAKGILIEDAFELCGLIERHSTRLLCDWRVHARVEVSDTRSIEGLERLLSLTRRVALISMMDHSAGRSRFASIDEHVNYYTADWGIPREEVEKVLARKLESTEQVPARRAAVARMASERGIPLASHDDRTSEQVSEARALGATIAEFPLTLAAATAARELGMHTALGAPNAIRGRSTSPGNLTVDEALAAGVCDALTSDYLPSAQLEAPLALAERHGIELADAVALTTSGPARAIGMDEPRIEAGRPLDAVLVSWIGAVPLARQLWRNGRVIWRREEPAPDGHAPIAAGVPQPVA